MQGNISRLLKYKIITLGLFYLFKVLSYVNVNFDHGFKEFFILFNQILLKFSQMFLASLHEVSFYPKWKYLCKSFQEF